MLFYCNIHFTAGLVSCARKLTFALHVFYCKFLAESKDERILKIGKHLAKLWTENIVRSFLTHSVDKANSRRLTLPGKWYGGHSAPPLILVLPVYLWNHLNNSIGSGVSERQMAENRYLPLICDKKVRIQDAGLYKQGQQQQIKSRSVHGLRGYTAPTPHYDVVLAKNVTFGYLISWRVSCKTVHRKFEPL